MFYSLSFCKDQSACLIYLQGFTFSCEHFHSQVPPGKSHAGGPDILSSSKLTCCFSNAVVSTAESEKPKNVLCFLSCSLVPFSRLRAWEQCWSLILRQSMYFVQLQDLNTIMLAWLFFLLFCFVLFFKPHQQWPFSKFQTDSVMLARAYELKWSSHSSQRASVQRAGLSESFRNSCLWGNEMHWHLSGTMGCTGWLWPGSLHLDTRVCRIKAFVLHLLNLYFPVRIKVYLCV